MIQALTTPAPGVTRTRWALIFGAWTAIGVLFSAQQYVGYALRGTSISWWTAMLLEMPLVYAWALATPAILRLGRRFPVTRTQWQRSVAVHLIVCNAFIFLTTVGYAWEARNVLPPSPNPTPLLQRAVQLFVVWVFADGLVYWMLIGIGAFIDHQRRLRERELIASQLETQLAQADLQALKMQLHPHFLFNALHTIGSLVRTGDRDNAVRVVGGLGDLLRRMLDGASQQEVPLEQELAFIRSYLAIEQVRFRDRLKVEIVVDCDVANATVPHLILQPLVENAIRHGIAPHARAGQLSITAQRVGDALHLVVKDDGPGVPGGNGSRGTGIGLTNARARLARLYGSDYRLDADNAAGGGFEARVVLPFAPAAAKVAG